MKGFGLDLSLVYISVAGTDLRSQLGLGYMSSALFCHSKLRLELGLQRSQF